MNHAQKKAEELYPDEYYSSMAQRYGAENIDRSEQREAYVKGFTDGFMERLSWEDIQTISSLCYIQWYEYPDSNLPPSEVVYKEVLRKFYEIKNNEQ